MSIYRPIVNIDFSKTITEINFADASNGVYLIAWWKTYPLAHKRLSPKQGSLPPNQIANLLLPDVIDVVKAYLSPHTTNSLENLVEPTASSIHQIKELGRLLDSLPSSSEPLPSVSIIIPTINRPVMLTKCLRSLEKLNHKPLEIIVVDNDPSSQISAEIVDHFPNVSYLAQPIKGASQARNLGARHCKGEILAFVDDDEEVDPNWLTEILKGFQDPQVACTTGLVLPGLIETKVQDFFESRFSFVRGYTPKRYGQKFFNDGNRKGVPVWNIGGSGNMAARREIFNALGGFDERLGGGHAGCSEDTEFFYRLLALDWEIQYSPRAVCQHDHRIDQAGLEKQIFAYMRGHVTALLVQFLKFKHLSNLFRLLIILPLFYIKSLALSLLNNPDFPFWVLRLEILGCISGLSYFWSNRAFWRHHSKPLLSNLDANNQNPIEFSNWIELETKQR